MTKSKHTKRALLMSMMSMLLCVAMLVGATFAWFTDSSSTGVNTIQAGTLDIELQMKNAEGNWVSAEGQTLSFVKAAGHESETVLWEPGCTYNLQDLKLVNKSNLALKYKVLITGIKGDAELNNAIDWTIKLGGEDLTIGSEMHWLPADAAEKEFTISGHMKEAAGNEYQGRTIEGVAITVVATQDTVEHDSNDNQYDKDAEYAITVSRTEESNQDNTYRKEIRNYLQAGENVSLGNSIEAEAGNNSYIIYTSKGVATLNLNGQSIKNTKTSDKQILTSCIFAYNEGTKLTVNGYGATVDGGSANGATAVLARKKGTVTINGGTYTVGGAEGSGNTCILADGGAKIIINDGFFSSTAKYGEQYWVLNCQDNTDSSIVVTGGTFVNFDPSNNISEGAGTNYVAAGYKVVSETQENGEVWYTVVPK